MKGGSVYILASKRNGTLYIGVTSDLPVRMAEHRAGLVSGFTKRYGVKMLVWYEHHSRIADAIQREKNLKRLENEVHRPGTRTPREEGAPYRPGMRRRTLFLLVVLVVLVVRRDRF